MYVHDRPADLVYDCSKVRRKFLKIDVQGQNLCLTDMSQPLKMEVLDASSGVVFPFYDPDLSVLYLAGRGDGNIRYYEMVDTFQHISYLNQFQSASPQRSLCAMPKRGLNVKGCEIARFYKLYATKNFVEPISMIVPRRVCASCQKFYPLSIF